MLGLEWFQSKVFNLSESGFGSKKRNATLETCPHCGDPDIFRRIVNYDKSRCQCGFRVLEFQKKNDVWTRSDSGSFFPTAYTHEWCTDEWRKSGEVRELQAQLETVEANILKAETRQKAIPTEQQQLRTKMPNEYAAKLSFLAAGGGLLIGVFDLISFWANYVGHPVERFFASVWRVLEFGIMILIFAGGGWLTGTVIGWLLSKTASGSTRELQELSKTMRELTDKKAQVTQALNQALERDRTKPYLPHCRAS